MKKVNGRSWVRLVLLMVGSTVVWGCFNPSIPIRTRPDYPIDVFFDAQSPDRPYTELQPVLLSEDIPLVPRTRKSQDRLLYRGNDMQQKDVLIARLVVEAQKLGADALVNVKYKVYTNEKQTGYTMEGMAVKYRGD